MKLELIKTVEENFQDLKSKFYQAEKEIILELEDELGDEVNELLLELDKSMKLSTPLELIYIINERSGFQGDINNNDDCEELLENIKQYLLN
jgi:hypothetical protein